MALITLISLFYCHSINNNYEYNENIIWLKSTKKFQADLSYLKKT